MSIWTSTEKMPESYLAFHKFTIRKSDNSFCTGSFDPSSNKFLDLSLMYTIDDAIEWMMP